MKCVGRAASTDVLTPADEKEDPLSKLVGRVSHHDGGVKVTAFHKHPEEVGHHKVVVNRRDQSTPGLKKKRSVDSYELRR